MRVLKIIGLIVLGAGVLAFGAYLRSTKNQEIQKREIINPWDANRILREMRVEEATATTTEAIEYRLNLARTVAEEGNEINITDCVNNPLVLKTRNGEEVRFENKNSKKLLLLMNGKDYYTIQSNSYLILNIDFDTAENNLIRYVCGEGNGGPTGHGFLLLE